MSNQSTVRAAAISFAAATISNANICHWAKHNTSLSNEQITQAQAHVEQIGHSLAHSAEQAKEEAKHA